VTYVASAKEVWVTVPHDQTLAILDASRPAALTAKTTIRLDGAPEGYATDPTRGVFFTNLEDKNATVVIDVATHRPKATWPLDCGEAGPRGLAADAERGLVFAACTDHLIVLDSAHGGAKVDSIDVGAGVDNIDWLASRRFLYAAAAKAAKAVVAHVDEQGHASVVASGPIPHGARNGVVDTAGNLYLADPENAGLLVLTAPTR
jgi:DNA-binding beta-propeller fold protein YncE